MATPTLRAHFDGQEIRLDEPFELPLNARLLVTVLESEEEGAPQPERSAWLEFSGEGLNRAYGEDEPEYTEADLIR